jgi:hypothetical protein
MPGTSLRPPSFDSTETQRWANDVTLALQQLLQRYRQPAFGRPVTFKGQRATALAPAVQPTDATRLDQVEALIAGIDLEALTNYSQGSFTMTATDMTTSVTGTAVYTKVGRVVTLAIPSLTGTSNGTTFALSGLPADITPSQTSFFRVPAQDNTVWLETAWLETDEGSTTLNLYTNVLASGWTASGTKSLWFCQITYQAL